MEACIAKRITFSPLVQTVTIDLIAANASFALSFPIYFLKIYSIEMKLIVLTKISSSPSSPFLKSALAEWKNGALWPNQSKIILVSTNTLFTATYTFR